ncbi:YrrS family protein [Aquibacillus rhizosphaerae]|uniref:YrrS family protein n=1 Tax=Aquibacillus rhizosphaerae TaxID=3051431 RepID=A0ABT7L8C3_9BACI|nr:YrrS family protein [Aquibacillus sp. LR5S19]MDL4841462.1 YrrS family protein [Aquibacillus sp. LR5S19]
MSDDYNSITRVNRFEKRRKNTKALTIFGSLGGLLIVFLIGLFIFGGNNEDDEVKSANNDNGIVENNSDSKEKNSNNASSENEVDSTEREEVETESALDGQDDADQSKIELETVESSDENVIEAFTGNWQPVGTTQSGDFSFSWETDSEDWKELMEAVRLATRLNEDDMTEWWVGRDGDQKVVATVSNNAETEIYRVYVTWVNDQGWKPTRVEILKENDQKDRFENNNNESETPENEQDETETE